MSVVGTFIGDLGESCQMYSIGEAPEGLKQGLAVNGVDSTELSHDATLAKTMAAAPKVVPKPFI